MSKHYPPQFQAKQFHCPYCEVFSAQRWVESWYRTNASFSQHTPLIFCICSHCSKWSYWVEGRMILPSVTPIQPPHAEMPADCKADYEEARDLLGRSPRAAAALLRLALQKLMPHVGESGDNINADIAALVAKGLPIQVQQALDYSRVVGNNAVHPGELDVRDDPMIAHSLFDMMNFIVEDRIARPKHIQSLYNKLPEGARDAIAKRDTPKT